MASVIYNISGRVIEDPQDKQKVLLKNYLEHVHNKFNKYAFCFFFCELLNILISISQVRLILCAQRAFLLVMKMYCTQPSPHKMEDNSNVLFLGVRHQCISELPVPRLRLPSLSALQVSTSQVVGGILFHFHSRLPPEERQMDTALNPMCEVFPKGQHLDAILAR